MRRFMPLLVIMILAITMIYAEYTNKIDTEVVQNYYHQMLPEAKSFEPIGQQPAVARALAADGEFIAYLGIDESVGYGGPVLAGIIINPDGIIRNVVILEHKETPAYITKITKAGYFRQYLRKSAQNSLEFENDINGVTGATLSTRAIANSVRNIAHTVAAKGLHVTPEKAPIKWQVGLREIAVASIFIASIILARYRAQAKYRSILLAASVVIIGFWLNRPLSMAHISAFFQGYFPSFNNNLFWYIVMLGAIGPAIFTGKNLYCHWVCPFCGLQEAAHLISKTNIPLGRSIQIMRKVKDMLLVGVLFLAFLPHNPSVSSFEPFGTIFGLNGSKYSWYLLFFILVASFFYRRFWCLAFCPVGAFLDKVALYSRNSKEWFNHRMKGQSTSQGAVKIGAIKNEN